jgi:hypothetical protein
MPNQYSPWSDTEISQLRGLAGKFPAPYISTQIGRGYDAVSKMIRKLGLPHYVQPSSKPRPAASGKATATPKSIKRVERKPAAPREPVAVRKSKITHISYPPLEWCPTCHAPVSNWDDHRRRIGCQRPAA